MTATKQLTPRAVEMHTLIEQYLDKGDVTQRRFCEEQNLPLSTFQYWLKHYRQHKNSELDRLDNRHATAGFIPVKIKNRNPTFLHSGCVIEFPNGVIVRFQGDIDPEQILSLIRNFG